MIALSDTELISWLNQTATGWRELIASSPEILALPCDVRDTKSVAQFLQHIVAVELRYAERLCDLDETPYAAIPFGSSQEIFATHDRAMALLSEIRNQTEFDWEKELDLVTRSAGILRATRRTVFVHLVMHAIRHYAQLATLVRQHSIAPGWQMDYLMMGVRQL